MQVFSRGKVAASTVLAVVAIGLATVGQVPEVAGAATTKTVAHGRVVAAIGSIKNNRPVIARGQVPRGVAAASVSVVWLPNLAQMEEGQTVTPVVLAEATTGPDGSYTLNLTPTPEMLAEAALNGGWNNLILAVKTQTGITSSTDFSRHWDGTQWLARDKAIPTVQVTLLSNAKGTPLNATRAAPARAAMARGCYIVIDNSWRQSTRVVNFHSASNATGAWNYGATADSDIDTGFKSAFGSWVVNGSAHVGNSNTAKLGGTIDANYDGWGRTDFRYEKYHINDYFNAPAGSQCDGVNFKVGEARVVVRTWAGGLDDDHGAGSEFRDCVSAPRAGYRGAYPVGSSFYKGSSRATRIGWVVGTPYLNLGGTSGYSTQLDMSWKSVRGNGIFLCGQYGDETGTPGIIYAQNRP